VTTQCRLQVFGEQRAGLEAIDLNDAGKMIQRWWAETPMKFHTVDQDASVVMPDHFHAIVLLECGPDEATHRVSLPQVMRWFKTMTTAEYFMGVKNEGWRRVPNRLWQRSYYDRVIRSEQELVEIRAYIESNPGARYESRR